MFVSLGPREEASASALNALSATPPLARTSSQVVRVPFADLHEVLHHDVGHQVVQHHLRLASSDLHRAVLEDVLDGRLLEPVAVVRDGGLDDARERDVVLGVSQEQVPARWRNVEGQGRRDGVSRRFAEEGDQIFS